MENKKAWKDLKKRRMLFLLAWIGWIPIGGGIIYIGSRFIQKPYIDYLSFLLLFLWGFLFLIRFGLRLVTFRCPNCNERFGNTFTNLFRKECIYCKTDISKEKL